MGESNNFRYDVFISYSHADKRWVRDELLPRLEAAGLTVCIDFRDFQIGAPSVTEMERAVLESRKTVPVLTPAFLNSAWTEFETVMLQTLDPGARQRRLIPLRKEPCELPLRLRTLTYVDFVDPDDLAFAWARLLGALQAPAEAAPLPPPPPGTSPGQPSHYSVRLLRKQLMSRCSLSDVKDLCFAFGLDWDNYPAAKGDFVRELLADLSRRGRVEAFVETIRQEKPWVLR